MSLSHSGGDAEAEAVLRRAVALSAADARHAQRTAWSRAVLAAVLAFQGRNAEAEDEMAAARRANPLSRSMTVTQLGVLIAWVAGDYPRALDRARTMFASHPGPVGRRQAVGPVYAALAAAEMGLISEADHYASLAVAAVGKRGWLFGRWVRWTQAVVDWRRGRPDDALVALHELQADLMAGHHRLVGRWALLDLTQLAASIGPAQGAAGASTD